MTWTIWRRNFQMLKAKSVLNASHSPVTGFSTLNDWERQRKKIYKKVLFDLSMILKRMLDEAMEWEKRENG